MPGVVDLAESYLAAVCAAAAARDVRCDLRFVEAHPDVCPVCGGDPAARVPYRGVVLFVYRSPSELLWVPAWACAPCGQAAARGVVSPAAVRAHLSEFLPDLPP